MFTKRMAALTLLMAGLPASMHAGLRDNEMVIAGGSAAADGLWISAPSVYLRRGTVGVVRAMRQASGGRAEHAYVLLIRGDESRSQLAHCDSRCTARTSSAVSGGSVRIGGRKVVFDYGWKVAETGMRESLFVNGKALDPVKGRVVLIDLSIDDTPVRQVGADLPKMAPADGTAVVETQARQLLDHLRRTDDAVRRFLP